MTNQEKKVPELRFPEFDGEWENLTLSQVIEVNSGRDYKHLQKGEYPVYGTGGYMLSVSDYLYDSEAIGIGRKGTINKPYLLKGPFWTVDTLFYCTPKENNSIKFLLNLFRTINWKMYDESTGVPSLSKVTINKINKNVPQYEEQQKIGEFFSKLDRQIELEEQKLAKLEEQKKGYMQQIFSQELRFKDENGNDYPTWKKTTIKEVAKLTVGKSKKNENTGKYIIMDMGTVTKNGTMLTHKSTPHENDLLNKGDLVMPKDDIGGGHIIGKTVFIPESQKYVLGDHVYRLETKKCNGLFLHFYINSDIVNRSLKRKVTGSAQLGLNRKSVEEELVKVPCLEEQEKIGAFFSKLDTFIEKQLSKIELLKERKKGFLQKMFV